MLRKFVAHSQGFVSLSMYSVLHQMNGSCNTVVTVKQAEVSSRQLKYAALHAIIVVSKANAGGEQSRIPFCGTLLTLTG